MKLKKLLLVTSLVLSIGAAQAPAYAMCCGIVNEENIIMTVTSNVSDLLDELWMKIEDLWEGQIEPLIKEVTAQLQGELEKVAAAQVKTAEAIATYQMQADLTRDANKKASELQAPPQVCQSMSMADQLQKAGKTSVQNVAITSNKFAVATLATPGPDALATKMRAKALGPYMTEADKKRYGLSGEVGKFAGADMDSSYLFGSKSGSETYDPGQDVAVDDMITRKTMLNAPPSLKNPAIEQTYLGKLYREQQRRYAAFVSNVQSAYLAIKGSHTPSDAGGAPVPSIMEVIKKFTESKFSSGNILGNAVVSQEATLRDIAIMDAARLWMDYQGLKYQERMLALIADQQVLLTEQVIGSRADAIRSEIEKQ